MAGEGGRGRMVVPWTERMDVEDDKDIFREAGSWDHSILGM